MLPLTKSPHRYQKFNATIWNIILWSALALPIAYIIYRAWAIDFTHDEALTYLRYVDMKYWTAMRNTETVSANNHILNTLFVKISNDLFGPRIFLLRLHSIAGGLLYILGVLALIRFAAPKISGIGRLLITLAFVYPPLILEYFSLARGYGLGLGLEIWALLYMLRFLQAPNRRSAIWFAIIGCLAVISNLNTIFVYLLSGACMLIRILALRPIPPLKKWVHWFAAPLAITGATTVFLWKGIALMVEKKELYYGGTLGLIPDTIYDLMVNMTYPHPFNKPVSDSFLMALTVFTLLALFVVAVDFTQGTKRSKAGLTCRVFLFIYIFSEIGYLAQHHLMGTPYPIKRTLLVVVPLIFGYSACAVLRTIELMKEYGHRLAAPLFAIPFMAFASYWIIFEYSRWNLIYSQEWRFDADNREIMRDVSRIRFGDKKLTPEDTTSIGVEFVHEPGMNFIRRTQNMYQFREFDRARTNRPAQFYLLRTEDTMWMSTRKPYTLLKHYPNSETWLYRYHGMKPTRVDSSARGK